MSKEGGGSLVVGLSVPESKGTTRGGIHPSLASLLVAAAFSLINTRLSPFIDAAIMLQEAREDGFDYVTCKLPTSLEPRTDVTALDSRWWRTSIVGKLDTSGNFMDQMEWAQHMSIPAVISPEVSPTDFDACQKIASMALVASANNNGQVWIQTRLTEESINAFDSLHRCCDGASNVGMLLTLENTTELAGVGNNNDAHAAFVANQIVLLHKAIGSNVKALCFPTSIFLTNKRGYPALSKTHQLLLTEVLRRIGRTVRILLAGPSNHKVGDCGKTFCLPYLQYIQHLRKRAEIAEALDTKEATLEEPYLDQLQRPLQPLADQLEFQTYETFEKDPVKYMQYQKATFFALRDTIASVQGNPSEMRINIMVVGAGRGPLVAAALAAIAQLGVSINFHIYAVEKNPSAIVYLESLVAYDPSWKNVVTVVHSDMRELDLKKVGGAQADIVISELLGSFGDNELSPECLDGLLETGIWKDSTVSIPSSYTAYLAPLSSMKLHSEARAQSFFPATLANGGLESAPMGIQCAMETPYVVRTHAASQTHMEQSCWAFSHPSIQQRNQERTAHLAFRPDAMHGAGFGSGYGPFDPAVAVIAQNISPANVGSISVHGLVGSFEATLYSGGGENIIISTRPKSFSQGMFSWFPLYFPLKEPLRVPGGATITCSVWRRTETNASGSSGRVWYEWCARVTDVTGNVLGQSHIHNPNGRSYHVTL